MSRFKSLNPFSPTRSAPDAYLREFGLRRGGDAAPTVWPGSMNGLMADHPGLGLSRVRGRRTQ